MEEKICRVITVSREYGAGGRSFAQALSKKLNIPWYDHDFVTETARDSGYSAEDIQTEGEELSQSEAFWDYIMNGNISYNSSHDKIFEAQKSEILKLAEKPCIIVGRCSNIILKEAGINSFNIFIHADMNEKIKRATELIQERNIKGIKNVRKYIEKREHLRRLYYKHYTKHTLGNYEDYSISFNTSQISIDKAVDMVAGIFSK